MSIHNNELQAKLPLSGFTNSSLYTGDIDYVNMPVQGSYWILPLGCAYRQLAFLRHRLTFILFFTAVDVQGNTISLPSGSSSYAAIDTGTTLVGGPAEYISQIFAQIPGSAPGTGNFQNYYTYRTSSLFLSSVERVSLSTLQLAIPPSKFLSPLEDRRVGPLALLTSNSLG